MNLAMDLVAQALLGDGSGGGGTTVEPLSVTANGTYEEAGKSYSPVTVNVSGGAAQAPMNDVMFYDYDGTVLYSYTKEEFLALNAMPANPDCHSRLVAKGWNWTLADAKSYVTDYGILDIGQMYDTASGETEMDIELQPLAKHPYLKMYVNGTATIKWGDGTQSTLTGTSLVSGQKSVDHEYASAGEYTISISGEVKPYFVGSAVCWLSDGTTKGGGAQNQNLRYTAGVKRLFISKDFHINGEFLAGHIGLRELTLSPQSQETTMSRFLYSDSYASVYCFVVPTCITSFSYGAVQDDNLRVVCYHKNITLSQTSQGTFAKKTYRMCLPPTLTAVYASDFSTNYASKIVFPNTIASGASISSSKNLIDVTYPSAQTSCTCSNYGCYALYKIVFPSTCTTITGKVSSAYSLREIHVKATTPPTVNDAAAFDALAADAVIYVPVGTLSAYQTAWSTWASKIQEEPA